MSIKQIVKKIYTLFSPQYRKICQMEQAVGRLERQINIYQARNQNMLWLLMGSQLGSQTIAGSQKKFWLNYPKADGDMQIVQQANLYLISCMSRICEELGISFWMHGGSLIGAVRHQGFIPWDDDVDVGMLREDLEVLIDRLKDDKFFQISMAYHDDEKFSRAYQFKLRDEEFCCFIDIFVFDYYPGDQATFTQEFQSTRSDMVAEFLREPVQKEPEYLSWHFAKYDDYAHLKLDHIFDKYLEMIQYRRKNNFIYYSIENYPFPYPLMEMDDIFPLVSTKFESITVNIPRNFALYLKGYGDYWQLPGDMERPSHFGYYAPHISYLESIICQHKENYHGK